MQAGEIRRDPRKIEIDSWGMGDKDERKPCERNTRPNFLRLCSVWWQITLMKNRWRMTLVIYLPRKDLHMYQAHHVRILYVSGLHHNSFPHTARTGEAIGSLSPSYPATMTARERSHQLRNQIRIPDTAGLSVNSRQSVSQQQTPTTTRPFFSDPSHDVALAFASTIGPLTKYKAQKSSLTALTTRLRQSHDAAFASIGRGFWWWLLLSASCCFKWGRTWSFSNFRTELPQNTWLSWFLLESYEFQRKSHDGAPPGFNRY